MVDERYALDCLAGKRQPVINRSILGRVVDAIAVDDHHLTEDQLLAKARELFVLV